MKMPSTRCARFLILAILMVASGDARAAGIDPLPSLLADDWDEARRGQVLERVRALGGAACPTLAGYAAAPDPRAR